MKKRLCLMLAAVLCMSAMTACAEAKSKLGDFSSRLKKGVPVVQAPADEPEAAPAEAHVQEEGKSVGPEVKVDSAEFEKVRSSAYLHETEYSREANVMIELKNVSGRTLYPDDVSITAYNAAGEVVAEETYSSCGPDMVEPGESLFVWDWFYGFDVPMSEIADFEVKLTAEDSTYYSYAPMAAEAYVEDGWAYAVIENATDSTIFEMTATIVMENESGVLLDVTDVENYFVGVMPGGRILLRNTAEDYANDSRLTGAKATAFVQTKQSAY